MIERKEFERRKTAAIDILKSRGLKAMLVYYDEMNIGNGWYLSGWCPQFESGAILVTADGYAAILGGPESEPFAKTDCTITETKNIPVFMVPDEEYPYATITSFKDVFNDAFNGEKIDKIGIAGMDSMPLAVHQLLMKDIEGVELVDITADYEQLRVVKSDYEIEKIQKAFSIADEGMKAILENAKAGVTESFLAGIGEGTVRKLGANWFGFKTIMAAGERSNGVVPTATERVLHNGEIVLCGLSARYEGYNSAACLPLLIGEMNDEQKDYVKMIVEAYLMTREMLKPGMVGRDNYQKIKKFFADKGGFDKYIVCPFVHTIGLHEAESPFYGPNSDDVLAENMTVCVDVSLFGAPRVHGVRVETAFAITSDGHKAFSPYMDKQIEDLMNI